jgi:hypothetical protein
MKLLVKYELARFKLWWKCVSEAFASTVKDPSNANRYAISVV